MMFTKLTLALAATVLAGLGVNATPAPVQAAVPEAPSTLAALALRVNGTDDVDAEIVKRQAGAGIHLVNCGSAASMVVYCAQDSNCNFYPANNNLCNFGVIITWEQSWQCTFPTGVTFSWGIRSDAQSLPDFSEVGTGFNGQGWRIFKDNKHRMFYDGSGRSCNSIYYSLPI